MKSAFPTTLDPTCGIWLFIAEDNLTAADRQVAAILRTYQTLADFREMGEARNDILDGLRRFAVGSYVIYYRLIDAGIEIVRVVSGARDVGSLF
jgi:toxin ParE1/3/4